MWGSLWLVQGPGGWARSVTSLPWPPHGAQQIWTEKSQGHTQTGRGTTAVTRTLDPPTGRRRLPSCSWQQAAGGPSARAGGRQPEPSARPRAAFSSCSWTASGSRPGTAALPSPSGTLPPAGQVRPEGVLWAWPALGPLGCSPSFHEPALRGGCGCPSVRNTETWLPGVEPPVLWARTCGCAFLTPVGADSTPGTRPAPVRGPARGGGAKHNGRSQGWRSRDRTMGRV